MKKSITTLMITACLLLGGCTDESNSSNQEDKSIPNDISSAENSSLADDEMAEFSSIDDLPEVSEMPGWEIGEYESGWEVPGPDMDSAVEGEASNYEELK